jgi:predicted porin
LGADFNVGPGVFSVDAIGGYAKDAVSEGIAYSNATLASGAGNPNAIATGINATISDNTTALVGVKYTWDKLKLYAGYEWIQFAPPSDIVTSFTDISGFQFGGAGNPLAINTTAFNAKDRVLQLAWAGGRYSITDSLDVAAAYYHLDQNNFAQNATQAKNCAISNLLQSQCAGTQDAVSGLIDWKFAPKWDTYFGTMYTRLNGGLDNGFLAKDNWLTMGGLRFRW